jgi:predicted nucleotidyltransferase
LTIPVVSLPGLAVLKLFAWADRRVDKDATDLYRLLRVYADAGNEDRVYDSGLAESFGFDLELAGANLLGLDVVALCHPRTLQKIASTFSLDLIDKLLTQMSERGFRSEQNEEQAARLVQVFFKPIIGS